MYRHVKIAIMVVLFSKVGYGAPECTIEFAQVSSTGLGVVSGKAKGDNPGPVYITVNNAGLKYTTLADPKGNWTVTYRYYSKTVEAEAWQPDSENSNKVSKKIVQN